MWNPWQIHWKPIHGMDTDNFEQYYLALLNLCSLVEGHLVKVSLPRLPLWKLYFHLWNSKRVCPADPQRTCMCRIKVCSPTLTCFWPQGYHQACKEIQGFNPTAIEDNWMLVYQLAWGLVLLHEHADYQVNVWPTCRNTLWMFDKGGLQAQVSQSEFSLFDYEQKGGKLYDLLASHWKFLNWSTCCQSRHCTWG